MPDYNKWFDKFNRTSFEKDGLTKVYGNDMEEIYQMFKARLIDELHSANNNTVEPEVLTARVTV